MKVFDASAVLALLNNEPGANQVIAHLAEGDGVVGAANYAEVVTKLIEHGLTAADAEEALQSLQLPIEPLTESVALMAGVLRKATRTLGLSLGERCCLALAQSLDAEVITADKSWKTLKGMRITLIR